MLTKGSKDEAYWDKVDYQRDYEMLCQHSSRGRITQVVKALNDKLGIKALVENMKNHTCLLE